MLSYLNGPASQTLTGQRKKGEEERVLQQGAETTTGRCLCQLCEGAHDLKERLGCADQLRAELENVCQVQSLQLRINVCRPFAPRSLLRLKVPFQSTVRLEAGTMKHVALKAKSMGSVLDFEHEEETAHDVVEKDLVLGERVFRGDHVVEQDHGSLDQRVLTLEDILASLDTSKEQDKGLERGRGSPEIGEGANVHSEQAGWISRWSRADPGTSKFRFRPRKICVVAERVRRSLAVIGETKKI